MCRMTSEESMTLYNSPYMRREVPLAYIGSLESVYVVASKIDEAEGSATKQSRTWKIWITKISTCSRLP